MVIAFNGCSSSTKVWSSDPAATKMVVNAAHRCLRRLSKSVHRGTPLGARIPIPITIS